MKKIILLLFVFTALRGAVVSAQEQTVEVRERAHVRFESRKTQPLATAQAVQGDVFIQRRGAALWDRLVDGAAVRADNKVRTLANSSVEILFKDSSVVRVGPSTEAAVGEGTDADGVHATMLEVSGGKVWADVQPAGGKGRTVVVAGGTILDSQSGSTFLEVGADKRVCVDTFSGTFNVRKSDSPDEAVSLGPSKRVSFSPSQDVLVESQIATDTVALSNQPSYTCLPKTAVDVDPFNPAYVELSVNDRGAITELRVLHGYGTVVFNKPPSGDGAVVITVHDSGATPEVKVLHGYGYAMFASATAPAPSNLMETSSGLVFGVEDSVRGGGGTTKSVEYQDVTVMSHVTVSFVKAEAETAAATTTATTATTETSTTTTTETATTETSTTAETTTTSTTEPDTTSTTSTTEAVTVCDTPPEMGEVTVNGDAVTSGGSISVADQTCSTVKIAIAGAAGAQCGTISKVSVTAGGSSAAVSGLAQWSATYAPKSPGTISVTVVATDSGGRQSDTFAFDIEFTREEEAPSISVDLVGGADPSGAISGLALNRTSLENGKLVVQGSAGTQAPGCAVTKVEVSKDNGSSWAAAQGTLSWTYSFTPTEGTYNILARSFDTLGLQSQDMFSPVEVAYSPLTDEDVLRQVFAAMTKAYTDRSSSGFTNYVSPTFTTNYDSVEDLSNLSNSLDAKFVDNPSIYLRYSIDSVSVSGTQGRVAFYWDTNQNMTGYAYYGIFVFEKDTTWMLTTVEDAQTFLRYTRQAGSVVVTSAKTALVADEKDNTTITVEARDSANNLLRDGSVVTFSATSGTVTPSSGTTVKGQVTATYTAGSTVGVTTVTAETGGVTGSVDLTLYTEHAPLPPP